MNHEQWLEPVEYGYVLLDPAWQLFKELSISDSDISVLSDPFSDEERRLSTRSLEDKDAFFNFSSTSKTIFESMEAQPAGIKTMMTETIDQIRARTVLTQIKRKVPLIVQIKIINLLNNKKISFGEIEVEEAFVPDEKKTWEDLNDEVSRNRNLRRNIRRNIRSHSEKGSSRRFKKNMSELEVYETMSGYWRLLSEYEDFRISQPGFNAYHEINSHWLETEPIPPDTLDRSRRKVLSWLEKNFQHS